MCSSPQLGPNVSIGEGVTVGEGVRLRESIVLHGATLQVGAQAHAAGHGTPRLQGRGEPRVLCIWHLLLPHFTLSCLAGAHVCSAHHCGLGEHCGALGPCGGYPQ